MVYHLLNQYGIKLLVIIYICISIYYKNIINVLILLLSFLVLRNMIDENNAILFSYIISLLYGIVKNFHLLENFKTIISKKPLEKTVSNSNENNSIENNSIENNSNENNSNRETSIKNNSMKKRNTINKKLYNVDSIISEELINQFINKIKNIDDLLIANKRLNIYILKPTIKNIKKNKIDKMKIFNNKKFLNKSIIISNDNFILDGHHRWFLKKNMIENNNNGLDSNELYNENIKVTMIDYDIKTLLKKLKEFKINYNETNLSRNVLDVNKLKEGYELINNIKNDISLLEKNYKTINNVRLV